MKNATTKKLFAFITTIVLIFSYTLANAQGNGNGNNGPCKGNKVLCFGKDGWFGCAKPGDCRMANEQPGWELFSLAIFPNPVSNTTVISFSLEQSQKCTLKIVDLSGRVVTTLADKTFEEGDHEVEWITGNVNAGVYFLQLQAAEKLQTEKLIVTK